MGRAVAAGVLCVLVFVGCGGSSNDERSKLLGQLKTRIQQDRNSLNSPDLAACVLDQAKHLPTAQLKTAADAPANGATSAAAQRIAFQLAAPCVAEGHGAPALRARVYSTIQGGLAMLPPAYASCVSAKAKAITNAQLASFLQAGEQGGAALHAAGETLGRQYGHDCLSEPPVLAAMRALFVKPIRTGLAKYSPAFGKCVLSQAEALSDSTLRGLISHPASAAQQSEALGRGWARTCVQRGIKP